PGSSRSRSPSGEGLETGGGASGAMPTARSLAASPRPAGASERNPPPPADRNLGRCATCPSTMDEDLYDRLRQWRIAAASAQGVPAYVVFTDATLTAVAERRPTATEQLAGSAGTWPR